MANPGARRVVTTGSQRAPQPRQSRGKWHQWRHKLGPAGGGILTGLQAVAITFLTITIPAVATFLATSGSPQLTETDWGDSLSVGTDLWLLGHGGTTILDGEPVTAIPLGISFLVLLATSGTFRRALAPTIGAWATAVLSYPLAVAFLGAIFATDAGRDGLWRAGLGALALALVGTTTGLVRHDAGPKWEQIKPQWLSRVPGQVWTAIRGGALTICVLLVAAGVLASVWILQGQALIGDVLLGLGGDWLSVLILAMAQLLIAPNLVLWAFAYLAGPGFAIGEGTLWAPDAIFTGPLPALPILGALPEPEAFLPGAWVYVLGIAAGALGAIPTLRRHRALVWYWSLTVAAIMALTAGLAALILGALSAGSLGPGRMAVIGPDALKLGIHIFLTVLIGAVLAALAGGKHASAGWRTLREKLGGGKPSSPKDPQKGSKSDPYSTGPAGPVQTSPRTAPGPKP